MNNKKIIEFYLLYNKWKQKGSLNMKKILKNSLILLLVMDIIIVGG